MAVFYGWRRAVSQTRINGVEMVFIGDRVFILSRQKPATTPAKPIVSFRLQSAQPICGEKMRARPPDDLEFYQRVEDARTCDIFSKRQLACRRVNSVVKMLKEKSASAANEVNHHAQRGVVIGSTAARNKFRRRIEPHVVTAANLTWDANFLNWAGVVLPEEKP